MSSNALGRTGNIVGSALLGALLASLAKGLLIGVSQLDSGWSWLALPVDMLAGPALALMEILQLLAIPGPVRLDVLPWAGLGALAGALAGAFSADAPDKPEPDMEA